MPWGTAVRAEGGRRANPPSTAVRARSPMRCAYRSRVICAVECPMILDTTPMSSPAESIRDANRCRRSWNRCPRRPAWVTSDSNTRDGYSGSQVRTIRHCEHPILSRPQSHRCGQLTVVGTAWRDALASTVENRDPDLRTRTQLHGADRPGYDTALANDVAVDWAAVARIEAAYPAE